MPDNKILTVQLTKEHLSKVKHVSDLCFQAAYQEDVSVYKTIIEVFPNGVWGAFCDHKLAGYIFFHPYRQSAIKPLNSMLTLNGSENCMYVHEIAVLPEYRTHRITMHLLCAFDKASRLHNLTTQSLVSVQNSIGFWEKNGFAVVREIDEGGYIDSFLMEKQL